MTEKDFALFDPEQLNIIGNLFADILEQPDTEWKLNTKTVINDRYAVQVKSKLFEIFFIQGAKFNLNPPRYDITESPSSLDIKVGDREYTCDFTNPYLAGIQGLQRLQSALTVKVKELFQKSTTWKKEEADNIIGILKKAKEEQKKS